MEVDREKKRAGISKRTKTDRIMNIIQINKRADRQIDRQTITKGQ